MLALVERLLTNFIFNELDVVHLGLGSWGCGSGGSGGRGFSLFESFNGSYQTACSDGTSD